MVLFVYGLVNILALVLFIKIKKNLHILEIIVYWMVATYLYQNFSALCYMNFKTIYIPEKLSYEFTHVLNRIILFPLLMVTFLNYFLILNTHLSKLLLITSYILFFAGLEWIVDLTGILIHIHWKIWWSFAYWLSTLLVLLGFMKFFRKILYKGRLNI